MSTNILQAVINIAQTQNNKIMEVYKSNTRINNVGDALEYYIRDAFCGTINKSKQYKEKAYEKKFSYLGNQNNPPDFIIKKSDAVEVKKISGIKSGIALNSSYPKTKLLSSDAMITTACKECEKWTKKDYIYAIGTVINQKLKLLWLVYGDCYAAEKNTYERIKKVIKNGVETIPGVQFSKTKELGKIKKVDPLEITDLRVRGMWHIENPLRVFDYLGDYDPAKEFTMYAIMKKDKYLSFPSADKNKIESKAISGLSIKDVRIKDPNNPAKYTDAEMLKVTF